MTIKTDKIINWHIVNVNNYKHLVCTARDDNGNPVCTDSWEYVQVCNFIRQSTLEALRVAKKWNLTEEEKDYVKIQCEDV